MYACFAENCVSPSASASTFRTLVSALSRTGNAPGFLTLPTT